ncbi:hypothetical protein BGC30_14475 [Novacetimonas hansenii]|nr:hypothetical protein BGC30_14475 [Novacetimonas hansenii]
MFAIAPHAGSQRANELIISPGSDASLLIWSDIGRKKRAEWQLKFDTTGEGFTTGHGMASHAICSARKILAPGK